MTQTNKRMGESILTKNGDNFTFFKRNIYSMPIERNTKGKGKIVTRTFVNTSSCFINFCFQGGFVVIQVYSTYEQPFA